MNRRSTDMNGWVNFPVNDPRWRSTNEGGMFVKLVVCDNREFDKKFGVCCGVSVRDTLSEVLIADDKRPEPKHQFAQEDFASKDAWLAAVEAEQSAIRRWEEYHFPHMNDENDPSYNSRDYLAVIIMGSTGWSGYSDENGLWHCTYDDLTGEGKALYDSIQRLYPECELHLLTFLDT